MCCPACMPFMQKGGGDGASMDAYLNVLTRALLNAASAGQPRGGGTPVGRGELIINKYPHLNLIRVFDTRTGVWEEYKDYGNSEVISGNAPVLGSYFQKLIGGRRGYLDVNVNGGAYPFAKPPE